MSREKTRRLPPIEPHRVENIYIYEKLRKREPIASPRAFDPAISKINKYYALPLPILTAKKKKKKRRGEKENSLMTMCAPPPSIPGKKKERGNPDFSTVFLSFLFFSVPPSAAFFFRADGGEGEAPFTTADEYNPRVTNCREQNA